MAGLVIVAPRQRGLHSFVEDYTLGRTIRDGDVIFRVSGPAEYAVTGADGLDFTYKERAWRLRDRPGFAAAARARAPAAAAALAPALLSYALALARRRSSALVWVPNDRRALRRYLLPGTRHRLTAGAAGGGRRLSLLEPDHAPAALRLLTSDGVTVVAPGGAILAYGGIVDSGQVAPDGVSGTGEAVAELLGHHGLALKVSQDGTVAVHTAAQPARCSSSATGPTRGAPGRSVRPERARRPIARPRERRPPAALLSRAPGLPRRLCG